MIAELHGLFSSGAKGLYPALLYGLKPYMNPKPWLDYVLNSGFAQHTDYSHVTCLEQLDDRSSAACKLIKCTQMSCMLKSLLQEQDYEIQHYVI